MAKLFLGLAIALMLAAAVLGFLAKGNIDSLQSSLKQTKGRLTSSENTLRKTEGDLKKTTEDLTAANTKIEGQTTEISGLKGKADTAEKAFAEAKLELDTRAKELADLKASMPKDATGGETPIADLKTKIEQMDNDLKRTQIELTEKTQMVDTLTAQAREKETTLAAAQSEVGRYRANVARQGLSGRVLAVNPGWNFVVLSVGDRQGAATGATMVVTRGGEAIGKARITSVEPSSSIADLIPGSFRKGVSVQPGDVVVYEGARGRPNTLTTPAPGGALPQP